MNKLSALALAIALSGLPAVAYADDLSTSVSADVSAAADASAAAGDMSAAAQTNVDVSASAGAQLSFDGLLADMNSADTTASVSAATAATATTTINIVEVSSLEGRADASATALADASAKNQARLDQIHAAVAANSAIQAKLTASGHDTNDVVAIQTDASGALWVYVDKVD